MKNVIYNSIWEYLFGAYSSQSVKILYDKPINLQIGMIDDEFHHLCDISVVRRTYNDYDYYIDACNKYKIKTIKKEDFNKLSDLLCMALMSQEGKDKLVSFVNKKYYESDFGLMNEALS